MLGWIAARNGRPRPRLWDRAERERVEQWQATALGRGGDWAEAFLDRCTLVDMYANHEGSIPVANRARSVVAELAAEACGQECGCWAELAGKIAGVGLSC